MPSRPGPCWRQKTLVIVYFPRFRSFLARGSGPFGFSHVGVPLMGLNRVPSRQCRKEVVAGGESVALRTCKCKHQKNKCLILQAGSFIFNSERGYQRKNIGPSSKPDQRRVGLFHSDYRFSKRIVIRTATISL